MSSYVKLFGSILDSTLWQESADVRLVWITMLAMSDKYGVVEGSVPGLAKRARVEREACEKALASFMAPDPDSRTRDNGGRRIEAVDGGWRLLNHGKYRNKLSSEDRKEYHAKYYAEKSKTKLKNVEFVENVEFVDSTISTHTDTDSKADADSKAEAIKLTLVPSLKALKTEFKKQKSTDHEAEGFYYYNESRGWLQGGEPMVCWKAAVKLWLLRKKEMV